MARRRFTIGYPSDGRIVTGLGILNPARGRELLEPVLEDSDQDIVLSLVGLRRQQFFDSSVIE